MGSKEETNKQTNKQTKKTLCLIYDVPSKKKKKKRLVVIRNDLSSPFSFRLIEQRCVHLFSFNGSTVFYCVFNVRISHLSRRAQYARETYPPSHFPLSLPS